MSQVQNQGAGSAPCRSDRDRPADVEHGCPYCAGPSLFIHGTATTRHCDRCDFAWSAPYLGELVGRLLCGI